MSSVSTSHPIELVRAKPSEAEAIFRLVREAYAKWVPILGREPLPMTVDYDRAVLEHDIDLLYAGRDLVGLIEVVERPDEIFIENVAVDPEWQGVGIGRRLLRHAEEKARTAKCGRLSLLTNEVFDDNIRIYESAGFRVERREPFMGGTSVYMSKALDAA